MNRVQKSRLTPGAHFGGWTVVSRSGSTDVIARCGCGVERLHSVYNFLRKPSMGCPACVAANARAHVTGKAERSRNRVLEMALRGSSVGEIATAVDISQITVKGILGRLRAEGLLPRETRLTRSVAQYPTGTRFGTLTMTSHPFTQFNRIAVQCQCDCGAQTEALLCELVKGNVTCETCPSPSRNYF